LHAKKCVRRQVGRLLGAFIAFPVRGAGENKKDRTWARVREKEKRHHGTRNEAAKDFGVPSSEQPRARYKKEDDMIRRGTGGGVAEAKEVYMLRGQEKTLGPIKGRTV